LAAQQSVADFCGNDSNLAEVLPGLLDAKSGRLFSQATGFPVRKGEKVTFMPSHAGKSYMQCSATRGNFSPF
jgi:hypothetical protein